jgi:Family of unknown function (DUF6151)
VFWHRKTESENDAVFLPPITLSNIAVTMTRAPTDLPLRCRCGHLGGIAREASPSAGFRFVCYCADCQAFARCLDRPDVLDAAGGIDIFQMAPGRVTLIEGMDALPILALIHSFIDCGSMEHLAVGRSRDALLGPPLCRIYERSATGPLPPNAPPPPSFAVFARRGARMLGWWMHGLGRPNPFFDERTNAPLSAPRVLDPHVARIE